MTPTGIALKVTSTGGIVTYPAYEAYGWRKVSDVIRGTYEIEHVQDVEIVAINFKEA